MALISYKVGVGILLPSRLHYRLIVMKREKGQIQLTVF